MAAPKAGPQLPPGYILLSAADDDGLDRSIYHNFTGDSRGYYHDGAYTAAPDYLSSSASSDEEGEFSSHEAGHGADPAAAAAAALADSYFASVTVRFAALRARLHQPPPQHALDALPPSHETEVAPFAPRGSSSSKQPTFRAWAHRLRYTEPLAAQVAAMDKASALRLLRVAMGAKFFRRGCALRARTSRWLWALLARLPDAGQMDSDDVALVRELGKRAVLVSISRDHVAALCEVLGREQVVALGLNGVLHEIEGRAGWRRVGGGEEEVDEEEEEDGAEEPGVDGRVDNDDEIALTPESAERGAAQDVPETLSVDTKVTGAETAHDLEDGELPDEDDRPLKPPSRSADVDDQDGGEAGMDTEEGEVSNEPATDAAAALQAMKAKLLSDLDTAETWKEEERPAPNTPAAAKTAAADDSVPDWVNMRATVNMILTVAGEFYGQRDLLAFRDPFGGAPPSDVDDDD